MDKRKNNGGTIGNKGGRPSKAEEVKMIERLSPLEPMAFESLKKGVEAGNLNLCNCSIIIMLVNLKKLKI